MKRLLLLSIALPLLALVSLHILQEPVTDSEYTPRDRTPESARSWNAALEYHTALRANQHTGKIDLTNVLDAREQVQEARNLRAGNLGLEWAEVGPDNIGGRTRAILVDPNNSNHIFAGSVTGGLFYSANAGGQWRPVEGMGAVNVSTMSIAPNGDIYVGTGCSFEVNPKATNYTMWPGSGVYKSTDGGTSFYQLTATIPQAASLNDEWSVVNRIVVDPTNSNRLYAMRHLGMVYSDDAGVSWESLIHRQGDCSNPFDNGRGLDIAVDPTGRAYAVIGGRFYVSDSGDPCTWDLMTNGLPTSANTQRAVLAIAPSDPDVLYVLGVEPVPNGTGGQLHGVFQSSDAGASWERIAQRMPGSFTPFGSNGQGYYDAALVVSPVDAGTVYIGGVQFWRWDGNLTQVASSLVSSINPNYVHADIHTFTFDPNNPSVMYIGSDGGIGKSFDAGENFFTANRGYNCTQFYNVAFDNLGGVIGGTQDNGSIYISGNDPSSHLEGDEILSGDGFGCEVSTLLGASFASSQFGNLNRQKGSGSFAPICDSYCSSAPFRTVIRLWESDSDPTSQSVITFEANQREEGIGVGNGTTKCFTGTLSPLQAEGAFQAGSIRIVAGTDVLTDNDGDGVLEGPGSGTFNYATGTYSACYQVAPGTNLAVYARYEQSFSAGATLTVFSNTGDNELPIEHTLAADLNPGESVEIHDPYQSMLAFGHLGGIVLTRGGLDFSNQPVWLPIYAPGGNTLFVRSMEFSKDGNHLFFGTSAGRVYRISGLNDVYTEDDLANLTLTTLYFSAREVTSVTLNPNNENHLIITEGNYGNSTFVRYISDALTATGLGTVTELQGNLPAMPVYDAEVLLDIDGNANRLLVGAEFGVWSLEDYTSGTQWSDESPENMSVPVFEVRQQRLGWKRADNHEVVYLGTHGRGIWKTGSVVSVDDPPVLTANSKALQDMVVFPNPTSGGATLRFTLPKSDNVHLRVYDVTGKVVRDLGQQQLAEGTNTIGFRLDGLSAGYYFASLELKSSGTTFIEKLLLSE